MLKIVIDTNVLVSALIKPESLPALVILMILNNQVMMYISDEIFQEYKQVLSRGKFGKYLNSKNIKSFLSQLKRSATEINPKVHVGVVKNDPADNKFLECALEAEADFFITGNIKHFPLKKFHKTQIVTPAEFLGIMIDVI
jgi:putative PIN family toxin of toxin-antitoxin system